MNSSSPTLKAQPGALEHSLPALMHELPQALEKVTATPKLLPQTTHLSQPRAAQVAVGTAMSLMVSGTRSLATFCMRSMIGSTTAAMLLSQLPPGKAGASRSTMPIHLIVDETVYFPEAQAVHLVAPKPYESDFRNMFAAVPARALIALSVSLPRSHGAQEVRGVVSAPTKRPGEQRVQPVEPAADENEPAAQSAQATVLIAEKCPGLQAVQVVPDSFSRVSVTLPGWHAWQGEIEAGVNVPAAQLVQVVADSALRVSVTEPAAQSAQATVLIAEKVPGRHEVQVVPDSFSRVSVLLPAGQSRQSMVEAAL